MNQGVKVGQIWVYKDSKEEFQVIGITGSIIHLKGNGGTVSHSGVKLFKENFQIKVGGK